MQKFLVREALAIHVQNRAATYGYQSSCMLVQPPATISVGIKPSYKDFYKYIYS